ncbi:MAG: NTP transferase domain-containing protein [Paramuribaculum sp.]|nr:NTP transferase domain-containing protein [Paramuribaculum sp.]
MNFAIIAAGEGSRLAAEGIESPKPLVKLGGRTLLERLLDIFESVGAESVGIIVNARTTQLEEYASELAAQSKMPVKVIVRNTPDSMHSFAEVTAGIEGRFCVTTVDTVFSPEEFKRYIDAFENDGDADGYMAVTDYVDDEKPLYVVTDADMRITAFEDNMSPGAKFVSGGIYALGPKALEVLDRCLANGTSRMRNYQRALVEAGLKLKAWPMGKIIDIDHAADITTAESMLAKNNQS